MSADAGFGLYVHWPFCAAKCPYCDFNSHVSAAVDHAAWRSALVAEIARVAALTPGCRLDSIFFGGGTPSLMQPATVAAIIDAATGAWRPATDIEITLEANPTSVEATRFRGFAAAGVNRVSLGVQALDDDALRRLGRMHDVAEAMAALEVARQHFPRTSFDLIYARQDQSLQQWQAELAQALSFGPDHLSLYQLTVEQGTPFARRLAQGGLRGLPDEDLGADLYEATQQHCEAAGLPTYEVSNHARPGGESRHNMIYWRQGDWAAIGPGAHGRLTLDGARHATVAEPMPDRWLARVADGHGDITDEVLSVADRDIELLMMGLRLSEGVDLTRASPAFAATVADRAAALPEMVTLQDGRLALTRSGRPLLNAVLVALLPD